MTYNARPWTTDDVPDPPFLHGTSTRYSIGDDLHRGTVREGDPDPEYNDLRLMCFATTSRDIALDWACRRSLRDETRDTLYLFVVELAEPEVDTNMHGRMKYPGRDDDISCVMSPRGRVVALAESIAIDDCDNELGRGFCAACSGNRRQSE